MGLYPVKATAALTGLSAGTLRAWERRHAAVIPHRDAQGRRQYDEAMLERLATFNPLQMHGSPQGVADCVLFLMTCGFITGQTLFYDGGYHLKAATYG